MPCICVLSATLVPQQFHLSATLVMGKVELTWNLCGVYLANCCAISKSQVFVTRHHVSR